MKPYYAPNAKDSSSGESYSDSDSEDSEQEELIPRKLLMDTGEEGKSTLGTGRDAVSESGSDSSTDDSDDSSSPAKVSAPISPEIKKRTYEASSKNEKFPRSNSAAKGETSKSVNALEDKMKSQKINVQSKKAGQQKEDLKKQELPSQSPQKAGQANLSQRKRKQRAEHDIQGQDSELKSQTTGQTWTPKDELLLASRFLIDMKQGQSFPLKRADQYWEELHQRMQGRFETEWSKDQIYDKYRRMKLRYDVLNERLKSDDNKLHKYKSPEEEKLFKVFQQLWGRESVKSNQKEEKPHKKSPTSSEEDDESSSSEEATGEEMGHSSEDEEESSEEDDEPVAKESALKPAGKKSKPSKFNPQQELNQNGFMQNDTEFSDHKTVLAKVQGENHISGSEEFEKALQAASISLVEESQTKLLVIFKEELAKTHTFMEKIFKEEQARTDALIEKIVNESRWFYQLLMTSLPSGSMRAALPRLLEVFTDNSIHSENSQSTSLLQQEWLQQQALEIEVNIQRSQLMQDILRVWQEQLKG